MIISTFYMSHLRYIKWFSVPLIGKPQNGEGSRVTVYFVENNNEENIVNNV